MKRTLALSLSLLMVFVAAAPAAAVDEDALLATGDLAIARPLGIASTVLGTALFILSLPFAATSGSVKETAEMLVEEPVRFTFKRPMGNFSPGAGYARKAEPRQKKAPTQSAPADQKPEAGTVPAPEGDSGEGVK